jgi:hypothetical protein
MHRFLTASIEIMGGGALPIIETNRWIESLHIFDASVPIRIGAITRFEFLVAEIYPANGALDSRLWYTASKTDAQLAEIIGAEVQTQLGTKWAVKVTHINRAPVNRPEFEEYSKWICRL